MSQPANQTDPRALALDLLRGVLASGKILAELEAAPGFAGAAPEVRARAGRLARSTMRHLGPADAALKPWLQRAPRVDIRDILRLATVEMLVEGEAPHGVVHDAVARARGKQSRVAGMVNAVLRRVAEEDPAAFAERPPKRLPNWLRGRLGAAYGNARVARMERVFAAPPPLDLTLRPGEDPACWATRLGGDVLPTGSVRVTSARQVSALPGYAEGAWCVQDAAAALPARLLDAKTGARVLDLCAAPGGKTLQLAGAGARVTALDISADRLQRLKDNLARTGLTAELVTADALSYAPGPIFDAVLLDAPCTATGTIRRHPDLPFAKDVASLKTLLPLQSSLVDCAVACLAPGGRLVLCTCSLLPEEGEALLAGALARHPGLRHDPDAQAPGLAPDWQVGPAAWRITPESWDERNGIDGFFIAALTREMQR
ncbi:MAG: transcription antitermination factor NusB [Pseudomonadota bacterium]